MENGGLHNRNVKFLLSVQYYGSLPDVTLIFILLPVRNKRSFVRAHGYPADDISQASARCGHVTIF